MPVTVYVEYEFDGMDSAGDEGKSWMLRFSGDIDGRAFRFSILYPNKHSLESWMRIARGEGDMKFEGGNIRTTETSLEMRVDDQSDDSEVSLTMDDEDGLMCETNLVIIPLYSIMDQLRATITAAANKGAAFVSGKSES